MSAESDRPATDRGLLPWPVSGTAPIVQPCRVVTEGPTRTAVHRCTGTLGEQSSQCDTVRSPCGPFVDG